MTIQEFLDNKDKYIGGEAESQEDGNIYRGPIQSIEEDRNSVLIQLEWCAKMPKSEGNFEWESWSKSFLYFDRDKVSVSDIGEDRLFFNIPPLGIMTLFPKGGSKLDPAKVKGLNISA